MKKITLGVFGIVACILLFIPVLYFISNFKSQGISNNISDWADFGSYIGGIVQPVISLLSLIVLGYITYLVSKDANKENLRINKLQRKHDAYEELAQYAGQLHSLPDRLSGIFQKFKAKQHLSESPVIAAFTDMGNEILEIGYSFSKYNSVLTQFNLRYGHLFKYDFDCVDFMNLKKTSVGIKNFFYDYHKTLIGNESEEEDTGREGEDTGIEEDDTDIANVINEHIPYLVNFLNQIRDELKE